MFTRLSENFAGVLAPYFRLEDLEESRAIVFGLWPDFTLAYFNPAWQEFAESNGGQQRVATNWGVGARYLDAIPQPLRGFYERFLTATPDAGTAQHPTSHVYECSSPTVFRKFSMQVYALSDRAGYIVMNSLVVEAPHDPLTRAPHKADLQRYVDDRGVITQCSHCRLTKYVGTQERWDWVPEWVAHSAPNTSHGLCATCFNYYYNASEADYPMEQLSYGSCL